MFSWHGVANVARAVSAIMIAEVLLAFFAFAKYMEIRQAKKDDEARLKNKQRKKMRHQANKPQDDLPPFFM